MGRLRSVGAAVVILLAALVLVTCGGSGAFDRLPAEDQALWERCFEAMRPAMCGSSRDGVYLAVCGRRNGDRFAEIESADGRREWLLANGCPPSMVSPRAYMAGGERPAPPPVPEPPRCRLPAGSVRVCESVRGYRFAVPMTSRCATGSRAVGVVALTCDAVDRPAFHACMDATGAWFPVRAWESCESFGYVDARGDFVPPGRRPELGVVPDDQLPPGDRPAARVDAGEASADAALPEPPQDAPAPPEDIDAGTAPRRHHRRR